MYPVLQIGGLSIQTPGLALLAGIWIALDLVSKDAARHDENAEHAYNAGFYALIAGLIAARLGFVIAHLDAYINSPLSVFSILPGSALRPVGLAVGIAVWLGFLHRKKMLNLNVLDASARALAVLAAAVAAANFLSGDGYGVETGVPWAIDLWSAQRHPTQVYELLAALGVLAALWRWRDQWSAPGTAFAVWVIGYGTARLLLEALRADSWIVFGNLRGVQVVALVAIVAVLVLAARRAPASRAV